MEELLVIYSTYFTHVTHHRNAKDSTLLVKVSEVDHQALGFVHCEDLPHRFVTQKGFA
jgi:hypothetical protein